MSKPTTEQIEVQESIRDLKRNVNKAIKSARKAGGRIAAVLLTDLKVIRYAIFEADKESKKK
jgi:hypothetical protein